METEQQLDNLINDAVLQWAGQGRTEEQVHAVRNFITGALGKPFRTQLLQLANEARIDELDRLIDIDGCTFNRWSQKDIAHFFDVVGKRYRELEQLRRSRGTASNVKRRR